MKIAELTTPLSEASQKKIIYELGFFSVCINNDLKPGLMELSNNNKANDFPVIATGLTLVEVLQWHVNYLSAESFKNGAYKTKIEIKNSLKDLKNLLEI